LNDQEKKFYISLSIFYSNLFDETSRCE